ncbi:hypothetical protein KM043_016341 [Ampulex compressa]|nr:hypothetical protein KM043_016341 [Ampulex compressa]
MLSFQIFTGLRAIRPLQINGAIGNERGSEGYGNHGFLVPQILTSSWPTAFYGLSQESIGRYHEVVVAVQRGGVASAPSPAPAGHLMARPPWTGFDPRLPASMKNSTYDNAVGPNGGSAWR